MSQDVTNDWQQREFIEKVELGVRKCVDFLNHFQQSARYRLSVVNQRLTSLERKLDYIENEIEHGDPHTRGAKPKPFEGSIFDPKARYEDTKLKLDRRKKQRGFTGNVIAPKKSNRGKMITVGTGFKGARKLDSTQKLPQGKVTTGSPNNTNKTPQNNNQQKQQQLQQQKIQQQKIQQQKMQQQKQQEMQRQKQLQEQKRQQELQRQKQQQEQQRQKQLQEQQRQKQLQEQQRQKQLQEQQRQKQLQEQQRQKQIQEQKRQQEMQRQKQLQEQQRQQQLKQQQLQQQKLQQQKLQQQKMQQQRQQQQQYQQPGQPPRPPGPPGPPPMQPGQQPGQRPPQPGQNQQQQQQQRQFPHGDPNRIDLRLIQPGNGPRPQPNSKVKVQYVGYLANGKKFISHSETLFLGQRKTIRGLEQAVQQMQVGSRARVWIPSKLAYGQRGAPGLIPPNSNLTFDIAVIQIVG